MAGDAEQGRELVEQAGRHPTCVVLGVAAQLGERQPVGGRPAERQRGGDLERGAR